MQLIDLEIFFLLGKRKRKEKKRKIQIGVPSMLLANPNNNNNIFCSCSCLTMLLYHVCMHIIKKVNAILDVFKFSIPKLLNLNKKKKNKCYQK